MHPALHQMDIHKQQLVIQSFDLHGKSHHDLVRTWLLSQSSSVQQPSHQGSIESGAATEELLDDVQLLKVYARPIRL